MDEDKQKTETPKETLKSSNDSIVDTEKKLSIGSGGGDDIDNAARLSLIQSTSKRISMLESAPLDLTELQSTSRYYRGQNNENISSPVWSSPDSPPGSSSSPSSHVITVEDNRPNRYLGKKSTTQPTPSSSAPVVANVLEIERIDFEDDDDQDDDDDLDDDDEDEGIRRLNPPQDSNNIDYLLSLLPPTELNAPFEDPIQIRGTGNMTLFGLSNCYSSTFPSALLGKVSKEEFQYTINRINHLLRQQHSTNAKFLLLGCLCCCFSLGCSLLWPTFALSRRTRSSLEKYNIDESQVDKSELIQLFQFTRALLNVRHIQTDVLLEELQNVEQKYEDAQNELDIVRQNAEKEENRLRKRIEELEQEVREVNRQRQELVAELEQKNRELQRQGGSSTPSSLSESGLDLDSRSSNDETKLRLKEKNEQIEQLLDKLYDADRINLDLAEQVAKLRVDLAKSENDFQICQARCQMMEKQLEELKALNENLIQDRERRDQELNKLRQDLAKARRTSEPDATTGDFYREMAAKEIEKLNALLEVKEAEIQELRETLRRQSSDPNRSDPRNVDALYERRDQIERLEEELGILSEGLVRKEGEDNQVEQQKFQRRMRKMKKQIQTLQMKVEQLEEEARKKDEQLVRLRKRMSMLIGGDDRLKRLLEENAVLNRMIRSRDDRIELLINQLNRHQLIQDPDVDRPPETESQTGSLCFQQEIELRDQLIALTVERDMLQRQVDAVKSHLESVHNENLELQVGMKEILDGLRQSDANTDVVLECPSLERACRLMENRAVYLGLRLPDENGEQPIDIGQVILLKTELDHVRGQNEQLRSELKNLRSDFLSVIDEYTTDILDNWTLGDQGSSLPESPTTTLEGSSLSDLTKTDDETEVSELEPKKSEEKNTEGSRARPRSRAQRRRLKKPVKSRRKEEPEITFEEDRDPPQMVDIGLDPKDQWPEEPKSIDQKSLENRSTQTDPEMQPPKEQTPKIPEEKPTMCDPEMITRSTQTEPEILADTKVEQSEKPSSQIVDTQPVAQEDNSGGGYVLMRDQEIQTKPRVDSRSVQTEMSGSPVSSPQPKCQQCPKYAAMLDSVKKLIDKEREHVRLQEHKQNEVIESLRENLKLMKKEYQLDLDAKNIELEDLRNKMLKLSATVADRHREPEDESVSRKLIRMPSEDDGGETKPKDGEPNKMILETIIECLQRCLKQKDEALKEYQSLVEHMRNDARRQEAIPYSRTMAPVATNGNRRNGGGDTESEDQGIVQMEKIYTDLFVKPAVKQNDQLMELLRSTLHQLESVRAKSREEIKQMETELETKNRLIRELESKSKKLSQQLDNSQEQLRTMEANSKAQEEKIQTLTTKLNDMIRRNQQSVQTASALKKKVENSVFQESADLRSKIAEFTAEIRRLQVEKWNLEKRLSQERLASRELLNKRDQQLAQQSEQLSKMQALIAKLEKKLLVRNKPAPQPEPVIKETKNQATQTANPEQSNRVVRFEIQRGDSAPTTNKRISSTKNKPAPKTPSDEEEEPEPVDDSSRQIVIDHVHRAQMSQIFKEVSIVAGSAREDSTIQTLDSAGTCGSCPECETKFETHKIEQHLIDLRLERLLDSNARLKEMTSPSSRTRSTTRKSAPPYRTKLDCDREDEDG